MASDNYQTLLTIIKAPHYEFTTINKLIKHVLNFSVSID